ncbi:MULTISPECIES: hypothetical protein [Streptomyces]|uniref:hypothetical protein n=1 Tax=Streptomyces TaxID=1883 RepID=UPI00025CC83F|nr:MULTISPECIES: hypothetical protein [Streptomyces]EIF94276.1 TetR family transcriptional regulator [Streptomyces tsukubensis NRRL18488]
MDAPGTAFPGEPRLAFRAARIRVRQHGLAEALQSDSACFETLHACFLDRTVPAYSLLRGIGNLCIGADSRYDARPLVDLLVMGLKQQGAA